jgi:hypothetical protein
MKRKSVGIQTEYTFVPINTPNNGLILIENYFDEKTKLEQLKEMVNERVEWIESIKKYEEKKKKYDKLIKFLIKLKNEK